LYPHQSPIALFTLSRNQHTKGDGEIEDESSTEHLRESVRLVLSKVWGCDSGARSSEPLVRQSPRLAIRELTYTSDGLDRHCEVCFCGGVERCACAGVQFKVHRYAASAMR
jgi:hypothetical protein